MTYLISRFGVRTLVAAFCLAVVACAADGGDPAENPGGDDSAPIPGASSSDVDDDEPFDKAACNWNVVWCRDPVLKAPECRASGCSNNKAKCKEKIRSVCGSTPSAGQLWTFNGNVTLW